MPFLLPVLQIEMIALIQDDKNEKLKWIINSNFTTIVGVHNDIHKTLLLISTAE